MLRHCFANPKLAALGRKLGLPRGFTVGVLESLWYFTATQAPRGDVGRWSNEEIVAALDIPGDPDEIIGALVSTRWLDTCSEHRLLVHDWPHHCDSAVKRSPVVQQYGFATRSEASAASADEPRTSHARVTHVRRTRDTGAAHDSLSLSPEPEPEPVPPAGRAPADAKCAGQQELLKTPKRRRKPEETADGQVAIATWAEAFEAERLVKPALTAKDKGQIREIARALGSPEEHHAALMAFFSLDDRWVRDQGYSPRAWAARWQACDAAAKARAASEARRAAMAARAPPPMTQEQLDEAFPI